MCVIHLFRLSSFMEWCSLFTYWKVCNPGFGQSLIFHSIRNHTFSSNATMQLYLILRFTRWCQTGFTIFFSSIRSYPQRNSLFTEWTLQIQVHFVLSREWRLWCWVFVTVLFECLPWTLIEVTIWSSQKLNSEGCSCRIFQWTFTVFSFLKLTFY